MNLTFQFKVRTLTNKLGHKKTIVTYFDCISGQEIKLYPEYEDRAWILSELKKSAYYKNFNINFKEI